MADDTEKAGSFELIRASLHKKAQRERAERDQKRAQHLREIEREYAEKKKGR